MTPTPEHPSPIVAAIIRANLAREAVASTRLDHDERMQTHTAPNLLDLIGPHRGPCALCGHPDARHRTLDAIRERLQAGDTAGDIAEDYQLDTRTIHRIGDAP